MTLSERLSEYIQACFTGIWVQSWEHEDALSEIAQLCHRESNWHLMTWDIEQGLKIPGQSPEQTQDTYGSDPLAAIRSVNALATPDSTTILVLVNFHRFINSPEVIQAVAKQIHLGKNNRTFLVVLSSVVDIPVELQKSFVIVEHELPDENQMRKLLFSFFSDLDQKPEEREVETILDAAAGLTRLEAEGAFALSLVRHDRITAETIWELKSQTLAKSNLLTLHRGRDSFSDLGGLEAMKSFCLRAMRRQGHRDPLCKQFSTFCR